MNSTPPKHPLLLRESMQEAEKLCISSGQSSAAQLMERAALAVALELKRKFPQGARTLLLCGPGNNGGDGLVVARLLQKQGWPVKVLLLTKRKNLHGFKGECSLWPCHEKERKELAQKGSYDIVVDALFGTGLARSLPTKVQALFALLNQKPHIWRVSIDLPSGIDCNHGQVTFGKDAPLSNENTFAEGVSSGAAFHAHTTITFFLKKQGQLLLPGRLFCGELLVRDIGIPISILKQLSTLEESLPQENHPFLWLPYFPWPQAHEHKYHRGHCLIIGQEAMPGASALAAKAAMRLGCGLCTLTSPPHLQTFYLQQLPWALVEKMEEKGIEEERGGKETKENQKDHPYLAHLSFLLQQKKRNAILIGPGAGLHPKKLKELFIILKSKLPCVIDADALNLFSKEYYPKERENFFSLLHEKCVLTPHEGEFTKLFPEIQNAPNSCKVTKAKQASSLTGATILLKGSDTVVAQGEKISIQEKSPPTLATAGSGDVLAGAIVSLMAQKMPPFYAASAATWIHSQSASLFGPGLIASDLPKLFPQVLRELLAFSNK